jgi:hypothetical protein
LIASSTAYAADDAPIDKSAYSLLNPVPDDKLRDFSTDRPGKSHSSTTVDVGRFQIESDFVNYTNDPRGQGDVATRSITYGGPIFKLGVTNNVDVEVGLSFFTDLRQSGGNGTPAAGVGGPSNAPTAVQSNAGSGASNVRARGFGDTFIGLKYNVFGNDGGDTSFAVLPFIKIPTAAPGLGNNNVEFTINAPYTIALPQKFSLVFEPTAGVLRNATNSRYAPNVGLIVNLSREVVVKGLTAAVEVAANTSLDNVTNVGVTQVSFDPSLQYLLTKNLQLDVGIYLGLNRATPRYNPYTGISYRF